MISLGSHSPTQGSTIMIALQLSGLSQPCTNAIHLRNGIHMHIHVSSGKQSGTGDPLSHPPTICRCFNYIYLVFRKCTVLYSCLRRLPIGISYENDHTELEQTFSPSKLVYDSNTWILPAVKLVMQTFQTFGLSPPSPQ